MINRQVFCKLLLLSCCSSIAGAEPKEPTDSEKAMAIAERVATGIEGLKKKYPNRLKDFSAEKHLREVGEVEGFAPGTPNNPELASIAYHNGILGRKPPKEGAGKKKVEEIFDRKTGVRIYVHFFKGRSRGNDMRPAEKAGDLNVHIYVEGPAGRNSAQTFSRFWTNRKRSSRSEKATPRTRNPDPDFPHPQPRSLAGRSARSPCARRGRAPTST